MHIRFKSGTTKTIDVSKPKPSWELRQTAPEVINMIDSLLERHTDAWVAQLLNKRGFNSGISQPLHAKMVGRLRRDYNLKSFYERLKEKGLLTDEEITKLLCVTPSSIKRWRQMGIIKEVACTDRPDFLYEITDELPVKGKWKNRRHSTNLKVTTNSAKEV